ncbi:hypothetical protein JRQ81_017706 [Phrynocephalus forsythii]|uniref:Uncharacterized protein n=1 Tax=Phrynocephalus forsythii TaxID=171643 RepID=A0A9Q1B0F6_9SAUR|nr:hypothetical protein JRQ81_017706 [Phrynocephalus forsythii]
MLAARTGGTVRNKTPELKKQPILPKVSPEKENRCSTSKQIQQKAQKLALLRELETNWYLQTCELSYEYTVAYASGMPHRPKNYGYQERKGD